MTDPIARAKALLAEIEHGSTWGWDPSVLRALVAECERLREYAGRLSDAQMTQGWSGLPQFERDLAERNARIGELERDKQDMIGERDDCLERIAELERDRDEARAQRDELDAALGRSLDREEHTAARIRALEDALREVHEYAFLHSSPSMLRVLEIVNRALLSAGSSNCRCSATPSDSAPSPRASWKE